MKIFIILFAVQIFPVLGQTWVSRARLRNFEDYFATISQQLILEVEKIEWCNLKLNDNTTAINQHMYEWHVAGNVTYTNGFVISIQRIDLSNIQQLVLGTTGTVRGMINFRDVTVGFDVLFDQDDGTSHRYTGVFNYTVMDFQVSISKNFNNNQISTTISSISFRAGSVRMIYLPANNITEVLSRVFVPNNHAISGRVWATEIMQPILHEIVTTKVEFPGVCFVNC